MIWNGEPAVNGILDTSTDVFSHGGGPGGFERNTVILQIPYNAFTATPKPKDAILVGGVSYTVHSLPNKRVCRLRNCISSSRNGVPGGGSMPMGCLRFLCKRI